MRKPLPSARRSRRTVLEHDRHDQTDAAPTQIGHNRPPADIEARPPALPSWASCARCAHWNAPSERQTADYEAFKRGISKRRVKEPAGSCDRVLLHARGRPAFAGTVARSRCFNFEEKRPAPAPDRRGFVTIYGGGRIIWQGTEGDEPAEYRQGELDL